MKSRAIRLSSVSAASLLATAALCQSAGAQCLDVYRTDLPDLDQRRMSGPGTLGLPYNGATYCAPASWADNLGYLANHGLPGLTGGQTYDWKSPDTYNVAGAMIAILGSLMNTDNHGTKSAINGLKQYTNARAPGTLAFGGKGYSDNDPPCAKDLREVLLCGGYAVISRGFYSPANENAPQLNRTGGHAHALRGVHNICDPIQLISTRDPATSSTLESQYVQALFETCYQHIEKRTFTFYVDGQPTDRTVWYWPDSSTPETTKVFDGYECAIPTVSVSGKPVIGNEPSGIDIHRPLNLTDGIHPTHGGAFMPPGTGLIRGLHIAPSLAYAWVIADDTATGGSKLIRVGMGSNEVETKAGTGTLILSSCVAHTGKVFCATSTHLLSFSRNADDQVVQDGQARLTSPIRAMCEDDSTRQLTIIQDLVTGGFGISRQSIDLAQPAGPVMPCPPGVVFSGPTSIAINPDNGEIVCCSTGASSLFRFYGDASGALVLQETIALPAGSTPDNLCWTDTGSILFTSNGMVKELERDAAGSWQPKANSLHAGQPVTPGQRLVIPFSRPEAMPESNVVGVHDNIAEENLPPAADNCSSDFDNDGDFGTDFDIQAFFACLGGRCCTMCLTSDFDGDGDFGTDADIQSFFSVLGGGPC